MNLIELSLFISNIKSENVLSDHLYLYDIEYISDTEIINYDINYNDTLSIHKPK